MKPISLRVKVLFPSAITKGWRYSGGPPPPPKKKIIMSYPFLKNNAGFERFMVLQSCKIHVDYITSKSEQKSCTKIFGAKTQTYEKTNYAPTKRPSATLLVMKRLLVEP